jgi:hypothetical protein
LIHSLVVVVVDVDVVVVVVVVVVDVDVLNIFLCKRFMAARKGKEI